MESKNLKSRIIKTSMVCCIALYCVCSFPNHPYPGDTVCEIRNRKGDIIFSCSQMENETCSKTYLGNTMTCNKAKEDTNVGGGGE